MGATVMPHSLFLGSHLATQDRLAEEEDLPKVSQGSNADQKTPLQRISDSIRQIFSWRRLFCVSRSDKTMYPPDVLIHADWENNSLEFVKSHLYHGMADMIGSLMGFAVAINSL